MAASRLISTLKAANMRVTKTREDLYIFLLSSEHSLTPTEIYNCLDNSDKVSIYRNLTLFNELGLVHKFQDGSFATCHQKCDDIAHKHVHFISHCTQCGKKNELKNHSDEICNLAVELKKVAQPLQSFSEIILQGTCQTCATT